MEEMMENSKKFYQKVINFSKYSKLTKNLFVFFSSN